VINTLSYDQAYNAWNETEAALLQCRLNCLRTEKELQKNPNNRESQAGHKQAKDVFQETQNKMNLINQIIINGHDSEIRDLLMSTRSNELKQENIEKKVTDKNFFKLPSSFFKDSKIEKIEALNGGSRYLFIYIKLCAFFNGKRLLYRGPNKLFLPHNYDSLAKVLKLNPITTRSAVGFFLDNGLMVEKENNELELIYPEDL